MPTRSAYVRSVSPDCGTSAPVLETLVALRPRGRKSWPLSGGERMKRMQLTGDRPLPLDRFIACLHSATTEEAVAILRATMDAAQKGAEVAVYPSNSADVRCEAELDFAVAAACLLTQLDASRRNGSPEATRLHDHISQVTGRVIAAGKAFGQ